MGYTKYTKEQLSKAAQTSTSMMEIIKYLGITSHSGNLYKHLWGRLLTSGIDTSHIRRGAGWAKNIVSKKRKGPDEIFKMSVAHTHQLRRALLESGVPHQCEKCGQLPEWNGDKLILQIDHIDGVKSNNSKNNLRFLCPNCHSQTLTYGTRNCASVKNQCGIGGKVPHLPSKQI